jgi:cysteine synthase A
MGNMKIYANVMELIGKTPLLRLKRLAKNGRVYTKCEFMNPLSLKDRTVLKIIEDAEADGRIEPGSTLIEATSGNTQSLERRKILTAFGAELILTPASEGTAGARKKLKEIVASHPEYFYVGQHVNPSNPKAHYQTTGPEIWADTDGQVEILIAGLGTGGTICGAGRYLKEKNPEIQLVAVEPEESPHISQGVFNPHRMMGTAPGFVPETLDREIIDEIFLVNEDDAFAMCRRIAAEEGLLVGISSGAVAHAALTMRSEFIFKRSRSMDIGVLERCRGR